MEKQGQVFDVFASEAVFLAEMSGYETAMNDGRGGTNPQGAVTRITRDGPMGANREQFSGKYVKHAIVTAGLPGGGQIQESSTWNVAHVLPVTEVHISLVRTLYPFTITVDVERDSMDNSMGAVLGKLIDDGQSEGLKLWWLVTFPGLVIVLIALCINFIGDGLRDALDPTQRRVRA